MANIVFKVGSLDLSNYLRVNPNERFDPAAGDMIEPAWSDSPFLEGQTLTSIHAKNKEMKVPLFLHPSQAPYLQDALNQLVQQVNQALRPVTDLGQTIYTQWQNAQASNPTFFTVQFGRFEPDFNFRETEKGWLAGILHLWTLPYGHTATERVIGTYSAPPGQSGFVIPAASMTAAAGGGTIVGDVAPQLDIRVTTGSYTGDDGQLGVISALPIASYSPIIPIGSFFGMNPSAVIYGASGAWASQFLAIDSVGGSQGANSIATHNSIGYFSFALSPASVYAGDNRLLGLVRARSVPFCLRAFDQIGNPIGPTAIASALDGWQLIDYGVLNAPPWRSTYVVNVQAYPGLPPNSSGMVSPQRAAPAWTKEHGPIFVVPNGYTVMDLDWNSPPYTMDGFDGASGVVVGQDILGNSWQYAGSASTVYNGNSGLFYGMPSNAGLQNITLGVGSSIVGDFEMEVVIVPDVNTQITLGPVAPLSAGIYPANAAVNWNTATPLFGPVNRGTWLSQPFIFTAGEYHLRLVSRASVITAYLAGPSGAYPGSASGIPLVATLPVSPILIASSAGYVSGMKLSIVGHTGNATTIVESFRARSLASQGHVPRDALHLYQPLAQNTRMLTGSGPDIIDLQARQRGPIQAPQLPAPSLGAGLFVLAVGWDQGPVNDILNVDVRMRERFTYAR